MHRTWALAPSTTSPQVRLISSDTRRPVCKPSSRSVTPHVLRRSAAMQLLQNGVDRTVIALWLGHESIESTPMYVHVDIELKEKAMAKTQALAVSPGRYRPSDELLAFLEGL
jgi:integrase/recombinase XerD